MGALSFLYIKVHFIVIHVGGREARRDHLGDSVI
jgi:hypothetical protein